MPFYTFSSELKTRKCSSQISWAHLCSCRFAILWLNRFLLFCLSLLKVKQSSWFLLFTWKQTKDSSRYFHQFKLIKMNPSIFFKKIIGLNRCIRNTRFCCLHQWLVFYHSLKLSVKTNCVFQSLGAESQYPKNYTFLEVRKTVADV